MIFFNGLSPIASMGITSQESLTYSLQFVLRGPDCTQVKYGQGTSLSLIHFSAEYLFPYSFCSLVVAPISVNIVTVFTALSKERGTKQYGKRTLYFCGLLGHTVDVPSRNINKYFKFK